MAKERRIVGRVAGTEVSYSAVHRETIDGEEVVRGRSVHFSLRPKKNGWRPVYPRWNDWLFVATLLTFLGEAALLLFSTWQNVMCAALLACWIGWWRASKQRDHLEEWLAKLHEREDDGVYIARRGGWDEPL